MDTNPTKRENERAKELAREYKRKGFKVTIEPSINQLPNFMRNLNYIPDLIVTSNKENFVIEVKSSRTIGTAKEFSHMADYIKNQKGWDFILVMTNPKDKQDIRASGILPNSRHAIELFEQAESVLGSGKGVAFNNASLLIAWAGIEAAIRYYLNTIYKTNDFGGPQTLIRDAVMYGIVSRKDGEFLESIMLVRNSLSHGLQGRKVLKNQVKRLIKIGKNILNELCRQS